MVLLTIRSAIARELDVTAAAARKTFERYIAPHPKPFSHLLVPYVGNPKTYER